MHAETESAPPQVPSPPEREPAEAVDPRSTIDEALAGLDDLDQQPVAEHVDRFEAVHTALSEALSRIDKV